MHNLQSYDFFQIISSVRDSLRYDLVQSHLDTIPTSYSSSSNNNHDGIPTLVLVLAVSGGCDSIALFHSILSLVESRGQRRDSDNDIDTTNHSDSCNPLFWLHLGVDSNVKQTKGSDLTIPCEVHVAHFNHEQRGESSDGDEAFARHLCAERDIPFHTYTWSQSDVTNDNDNFTQDTARQWRRQKLKQLLSDIVLSSGSSDGRWGAILTAHHRDDADETILLKLLRGSHLTNLRGMDARSDGFDLVQLSNKAELKSDDEHHMQPTTSVGYFAKPMLNVRKHHIVEYLKSNSLEWREDESNASSKYKRNKVRNELIPLMSEIAGGDHALQKRIRNLEQQSRDISKDLTNRSKEYLEFMPSSSSSFLLQRGTQFDVVQEEALYLWMKGLTNNRLQISYDQMLRIRDQINDHPDRLQWTLDVGQSWKIRRNGDTLAVLEESTANAPISSDKAALFWVIITGSDYRYMENISDTQELSFDSLPDKFTMDIKQVKDCRGIKFTPPWRKGRSAIKIKEFLRGQKVPLHLRDTANVLCLSDNSTTKHALAVYIEGEGIGWIVNANFCPQDDSPKTTVVLGKISHQS